MTKLIWKSEIAPTFEICQQSKTKNFPYIPDSKLNHVMNFTGNCITNNKFVSLYNTIYRLLPPKNNQHTM